MVSVNVKMKLTTSLLTVAALLSSCVSSIPFGIHNGLPEPDLAVRTGKEDYPIGEEIARWLEKQKGQLQHVCTTTGGWEGTAQLGLEKVFKKAYDISTKKAHKNIREARVYTKTTEAADFALPPSDTYNGMIIELKCENRNSNAGAKMKTRVAGDINKAKNVKNEYKDYTFVVVAMAYSQEAENELTKTLGLTQIQGAEITIEGSDYSSSQSGSNNGDKKEDSDTEMTSDKSDGDSESGQSDSKESATSSTDVTLKVYQKKIDFHH